MASLSQSLRYLQVETSLGKDVLILTQASGHERLGGLFEISIEFTKQSGDLDLDGLLGTSATLGIHNAAESRKGSVAHSRYFNGYFSRIAFAGYGGEGQARFQATMVPWLWFLTRTADCRIFQQKSVPDILEEVFRDAGFSDFKKDLRGSYQPRDFCVQYRETDFNFVSRLMESEGIYYYFEHQNGSHKMVLCDDMVCHKKDSKHETIKFIGGADARDTKGVITDWSFAKQVKPGKFAHNEFNFKTPTPDPNLRLLARASAPKPQKPAPFEIYDNLGGYETIGEGNRYARLRMEEIISDRDTAQARTNIIGIKCGCKFKLDKHPISDQNKEYLITSVHWSAAEGGYGSGSGGGNFFDCDFSSIPAASTYRPLRVTPLPKIEGPQTATVCGPSGQEIYVDKHARVKVQFHWDRYGKSDAGSSCWIRVSQPWAGGAFGGMAIPRIGHEVIVEFIEADPDRPIITGRVFNGHNQPFASNAGRDGKPGNVKPKDITQAAMMTSIKSNSLGKTGGSNEITMNDMSGKEGLFIKAQKDEIHKVGNDREDEVGNDEKRKVKNNRTREVGVNEKILIGSNQNVQIKGSSSTSVAGSRSVSVGGAGSLSIGKDYKESVGKNYSVKATNKYELKAREIGMEADMKMSAKAMKSTLEGKVSCSVLGSMITLKGNTIVLKAGGSSILLTPTCIMIDAPMLLLNSGGAPVQALAAGALSGFALAMAAMGQLGMIAAGAGMAVAALAGRGLKAVAQKVTSLTGRLYQGGAYSAGKFMAMTKQAAAAIPGLFSRIGGSAARAAVQVGKSAAPLALISPALGVIVGLGGALAGAAVTTPQAYESIDNSLSNIRNSAGGSSKSLKTAPPDPATTKFFSNLAYENDDITNGSVVEGPDGRQYKAHVIDPDPGIGDGGFRSVVFVSSDSGTTRAVQAFAGTNMSITRPGDTTTDLATDAIQHLGGVPAPYKYAAYSAKELKNIFGNDLVLVGHSLGAGEAQYAGGINDIPTSGINSAPLGGGSLSDVRDATGGMVVPNVRHYNNEGDIVSRTAGDDRKLLGEVCVNPSNNDLGPLGTGTVGNHLLDSVSTDEGDYDCSKPNI